MRRMLVLASAVVFTGCALVRPATVRCSESPELAVFTFIRNLVPVNVPVLRSLFPPDLSLLAAFGDGDANRGLATIRQLSHYPIRRLDEEADTIPSVAEIRETGNPDERIIVVESAVEISSVTGNEFRLERKERYRRSFIVLFGWGSCIRSIRALEPEWERIE